MKHVEPSKTIHYFWVSQLVKFTLALLAVLQHDACDMPASCIPLCARWVRACTTETMNPVTQAIKQLVPLAPCACQL